MLTETNASWLISETIKALEIKTSMIFNSGFAKILFYHVFFFFFLIVDLYFSITGVTAQINTN